MSVITSVQTMPDDVEASSSPMVLLVDDDPDLRDLFAMQLEFAAFQVSAVSSGKAALWLLDAGAVPGVLVTDLAMPEMCGWELIRRARQRLPGLPVVLLSGSVIDPGAVQAEGLSDEGLTILRKPVRGAVLADTVQSLLAATIRTF